MVKKLKQLSRKRPTTEELDALTRELETDGPRGVAVLASTLVEDVLAGALLDRMVELTKDEHEHLFFGTSLYDIFCQNSEPDMLLASSDQGHATTSIGCETYGMCLLIPGLSSPSTLPRSLQSCRRRLRCLSKPLQAPSGAREKSLKRANMLMLRLIFADRGGASTSRMANAYGLNSGRKLGQSRHDKTIYPIRMNSISLSQNSLKSLA